MASTTRADATLLTGFPVSGEDVHYLPASLRNTFVEIAWNGMSAEVSGEVLVEGEASQVWVVATAYDREEKIVGVRRWETVSGEREFYLTVASLGHAIERVDLIVEAKN